MSTTQLWQVRLQRFSLDDRDPLSCFNEHVKGPLRALVESQIGSELHVPFQIALTAWSTHDFLFLCECAGLRQRTM